MKMKNWVIPAAIAAFCTFSAFADHGGGNDDRNNNRGGIDDNAAVFTAGVVGSAPGVSVGGVNAGGAPWVVKEGRATVSRTGRIRVEVQGLLIAAGPNVNPNLVGTVGPVQNIAASLVCSGSGGTVAASTSGFPLSAAGSGEIEASVTLPAACVAPVILIRNYNSAAAPGAELGAYVALTGLTRSSNSASSSSSGSSNDDPLGHH